MAFEFVTESTIPGRRTSEATYRHRYELEPLPGACRVTYSFRQERLDNPLLRVALPLVRDVTWDRRIAGEPARSDRKRDHRTWWECRPRGCGAESGELPPR